MSRPNQDREAPLGMDPEEFRELGRECVDMIAGMLAGIRDRPLTRGHTPSETRRIVGDGAVPEDPSPARDVVREIGEKLIEHSLYNGHPRFLGYITSSPAPIGALADLLAAAVNPNVGSFSLSPVATTVEAQTIRWIAELLGFPAEAGGILVTGGNMANIVCFLAARRAGLPGDVRRDGVRASAAHPRVYVSADTHTWIEKAADMSGIGTDAIRWIPVDSSRRMDLDALERRIADDRAQGDLPLVVVGNAGTVGTGAVDRLPEMGRIAKRHELWFHVDGAYGAFAVGAPGAPADLGGISAADSVAVDPHKWLYTPLECGCALVRDRELLRSTFSYHPSYYRFAGSPGDEPTNYYEFGPQNSRGFRALKVWMGIRQAGRKGIMQAIGDDIALARVLSDALGRHPEFQTFTLSLSIVTFRYVPPRAASGGASSEEELNGLNSAILERLQAGGEAYVSNAVLEGRILLRACVVNFRTTAADMEALPEIIARYGRAAAAGMAPGSRGD